MRWSKWVGLLFLLLVASGSGEATTFAQSGPELPLPFVIHISVDGLRGDLLQSNLDGTTVTRYSNFERLRAEGAYSFNARADVFFTNTIPNHTTMLTGRPVLRPRGFPNAAPHQYISNQDPQPDWTLHNRGNPYLTYIPSVFDVAHEQGLRTALFTGKSKFVLFEQSYGGLGGAGEEIAQSKIDHYLFNEDTEVLVTNFLDEMKQDPFQYTFFHFRDPDSAGHAHGWGGEEWNTAVERVDGFLGRILDTIEQDDILRGQTALVLTADHGGSGKHHWNNFSQDNYTIPVFIWAPGIIPASMDVYELYAKSVSDPGSDYIRYSEKPQPIRNGSTGNFALHLLGLLPIPGSMIDSPYFITHCGLEEGKQYDFGETLAQIEVIQAGDEACLSVGFADTAETDYWQVITYGEGVLVNLTLPYKDQTFLYSPTICAYIEKRDSDCQVQTITDFTATRSGISQTSTWIVKQQPDPRRAWPFIVAIGILLIIVIVFFSRRRRRHSSF